MQSGKATPRCFSNFEEIVRIKHFVQDRHDGAPGGQREGGGQGGEGTQLREVTGKLYKVTLCLEHSFRLT